MKEFFKNHKKGIITNLCIALLIAIIAVIAIFATTSFAESSSIGKDNAQNFAFVDAGIDPSEAKELKTEFEFENGQFIYDVEFVSNGTEYEYWIKASNGSIIKKEVDSSDEIIKQKETNNTEYENEVNNEQSKNNVENDSNTQKEETNSNDIISLETAKNKALSDAGVSASKCTFTKAKLDIDDGIKVYDIEFKTSSKEYEYEIDAKTGKIRNKEIENIKGNSKSSTTTSNTNKDNNSSYIGIDKAKSIALTHAGVSNVTFEKAKLDRDDGKTVYEIEFYKGGMEYSYEIDALTGKILDYEKEND